jgi:UDP-2-acetamido-3-amino-2,3-dideoxy-glucuronate N-acetyltransferase
MIAHIGCGYWGRNIVRTLNSLNILRAVYDFDTSVRQSFSNEYNLDDRDLNSILDDESILGISIATPANTHFEIARQALLAGKSVFIEKPICLDLNEAKDLKKIADNRNLKIMVGHLMHYHCGFMKLKGLIDRREFGEILKIKSYRKSFGILRQEEDVIWSFAPHDLSMIMALFEDKNIFNLKVIRDKIFNANTDAAIVSYSCGDVSVSIDVDWTSSYKQQRLEVYCKKGVVILDDTLPEGKKLFSMQADFSESALMQKTTLKSQIISYENLHDPLAGEMKAFRDLLIDKSECINDVDEATMVLKILKEIESCD